MITVLASPPGHPPSLLRASDLFGDLADAALREAADGVEWCHLLGGDVLFRQGDAGDALYVVASGRLRAVAEERDGAERPLREIGRGGHVGELALLTDEPRSATVRAVRDTVLARFSRQRFQEVLSRHPTAMLPLTRALAAFMRRAHLADRSGAGASTVALVPLHAGLPLAALAEQLAAALAAHGPTLGVDLSLVERRMPGAAHGDQGHPAHSALSAWLDELEVSHRHLVYQGDLAAPAWTQRCMREADRVLFVAAAGGDRREAANTLARLQRGLTADRAREELVLMHADGSTPSGTAAWLALRPVAAHHHVCLSDRRHVQRLVRCLTGTSVGLVLSGGAAKGFAHIGVLRALEEAGLPIDQIGGTSMGSVIGAQYAAGVTPAEMLELNRLWLAHNPLRDLTLPVIALISGTSGLALLEAMFGDRRIEDLWLDYFCVAANLTRSQVSVHREGPLQTWVRASISIPGIVPPMRLENGDLLVDGAVLNNLPADIMHARGAGRIIAVDVTPPEALPTEDYVDQPSMWQRLRLLQQAVVPVGTPLRSPTIFSILYRTTLTASRSLSERLKHDVDLYLTPPVSGVGFFDWKALEHIAEIGYQDTRRALAERPAEATMIGPIAGPRPRAAAGLRRSGKPAMRRSRPAGGARTGM